MIDPGLKAILCPFHTGRLVQGKAAAVTPGEVPEFLQPVRMGGQPGIIQLYRLPAELLQLPACQHGADGCLPHGSHALFDQLFRLLIRLPFLEQVLQFLPAFLIQPHSKPFPAQCDRIAGDKDELAAILFEYAGGAALAPAFKGMQAEKGHIITNSQVLHQRLLLSGIHFIKLGAV